MYKDTKKDTRNIFEIDNHEIGIYVSKLIDEKYGSARKFCIAYLQKKETATGNDAMPNNDAIQNMENRLSQIKKGAKAIQIYDLPIFSNLLDVSFEQILSAGKYGVPKQEWIPFELLKEDPARTYIISLAADYSELELLKKMRAREIPDLYNKAHFLSCTCPDCDAYYDASMISHIAKSSEAVLEYFTEPFEIRDHINYSDSSRRTHTFMFPHISQLLDMLIENNSPFLKTALEKSITHNEETLEKLTAQIKKSVQNGCYREDEWQDELIFCKNGNIISFRDRLSHHGIITNIVHAAKESTDGRINELIEHLNRSFDQIHHIKTKELI